MYYPLKNQQQPISYFFLTHNCQEKNIAGILKSINHILRSIELDKFLWLGLNYNKVLKNNSDHNTSIPFWQQRVAPWRFLFPFLMLFGCLVMELCPSLLVTLRFPLFAPTHAVKRWILDNEYDDNQIIFNY